MDAARPAPACHPDQVREHLRTGGPAWITMIATAVDRYGLDALAALVTELARLAGPRRPAAAAVLVDRGAPRVARHRAFAVVAAELLRLHRELRAETAVTAPTTCPPPTTAAGRPRSRAPRPA